MIVLDLVGTVAFAISGAAMAIRKQMDLLGVVVLGVTTAVGGGALRDILLGNTPPQMFRQPLYTGLAALVSVLVFLVAARNQQRGRRSSDDLLSGRILQIADSLGLGAFTVIGVETAMMCSPGRLFLASFVGVLTGVGGGVLRDVLAAEPPYIFHKHVYAVSSMAGAVLCACCWEPMGQLPATLLGGGTVVLLRYLAIHFEWNLPKIR